MIALTIADVRGFMAKLLKQDVFDDFELSSAVVHSFARFEFYGDGGKDGRVAWGRLRAYVYDIIKGEVAPRSIKIVLAAADSAAAGVPGADGLFINIIFEEGKITVTSGMFKKGFSLDRSDGRMWDKWVLNFFDENNIKYINNLDEE